jgi:hypothetical protein
MNISTEVEIGDGEDYVAVIQDLERELASYVEEAIDQAREEDGLPAIYSQAERYDLWLISELDTLVVVPAAFDYVEEIGYRSLWGEWRDPRIPVSPEIWYAHRGQRLHVARQMMYQYAEAHPDITVKDWTEVDPQYMEAVVWRYMTVQGAWARGCIHRDPFTSVCFHGPVEAFRDVPAVVRRPLLFPSQEAESVDAQRRGLTKKEGVERIAVLDRDDLISAIDELTEGGELAPVEKLAF